MTAMGFETKKDKFRRLAEKRMNNALNQIKLIGNLSNAYFYDYSPEDADIIIKALKKAVFDIENKFISNPKDNDAKFKF